MEYQQSYWMGLWAAVVVGSCLHGCTKPALTPAEARSEPTAVATVTAQPAPVVRTCTQPATVHAFHETRILAKTSGYLGTLNVDIGSQVKADDVLAEIAVPEIEKQLERAEASLTSLQAATELAKAGIAVAQAQFTAAESELVRARAGEAESDAHLKAEESERDRVANLVQQKAVADRLLDEATKRYDASAAAKSAAAAATAAAQAQVQVARAQLAAANAQYVAAEADVSVGRKHVEELQAVWSYSKLRAPFDGVVIERHVELGDLVHNAQNNASGQPLFTVAKTDVVRVRVAIPERDAPLATVGDKTTIALQALPGESFEGEIARIAPGLNTSTRTMLVEIDLPNPDGRLIPGMFGQATIELESPEDRVALPAGAVRFDETGKSFVYVVDSTDTVQVQEVTTGVDDGTQIEITSGLQGGERIVGPQLRPLRAGQRVRVRG